MALGFHVEMNTHGIRLFVLIQDILNPFQKSSLYLRKNYGSNYDEVDSTWGISMNAICEI